MGCLGSPHTHEGSMTFLHFPTLFSGLFAAAQVRHASYWGECVRCERTTPWYTNAMRGEYRCTECGHSPLSKDQ